MRRRGTVRGRPAFGAAAVRVFGALVFAAPLGLAWYSRPSWAGCCRGFARSGRSSGLVRRPRFLPGLRRRWQGRLRNRSRPYGRDRPPRSRRAHRREGSKWAVSIASSVTYFTELRATRDPQVRVRVELIEGPTAFPFARLCVRRVIERAAPPSSRRLVRTVLVHHRQSARSRSSPDPEGGLISMAAFEFSSCGVRPTRASRGVVV